MTLKSARQPPILRGRGGRPAGDAGGVPRLGRVPLKLIHGPPNSGKRGEVLRGFGEVLDRDPVLVLPTTDDVFDFERELSAAGAVLGGAAMTFGALFRTVATAAGTP